MAGCAAATGQFGDPAARIPTVSQTLVPGIPHTSEVVGAVQRAIRDEVGIETELSTTGGTSDGRFIAQVCPQVIELGPPNATIHKINEFVAVADLDPLKNIYRRVLEQLHGLASTANTSAQ